MKWVLVAGYFTLVGYGIGKLDLDRKFISLVKRETTELIAYAKAVPPAPAIDLRKIDP